MSQANKQPKQPKPRGTCGHCLRASKLHSPPPPKTNLHLTAVGGEQPSRGMPGGAGPSGVKVIDQRKPPRALREVERLTRNPEKLANAGGRCWKDTLGRKRSFGTHRPPYPTRRGLVTTWQETKKLLHDDGFE